MFSLHAASVLIGFSQSYFHSKALLFLVGAVGLVFFFLSEIHILEVKDHHLHVVFQVISVY